MTKKVLFLTAVIAANYTLAFADDYTSLDKKANYTYASKDITTEIAGDDVYDPIITVSKDFNEYSIIVNCDKSRHISNRRRTIKTTLVSLASNVSNYTPVVDRVTLVDEVTNEGVVIDNDKVILIEDNEDDGIYTVETDNPLYNKYVAACEDAASMDSRIVKYSGIPTSLKSSGIDVDEYALNPDLYYMLQGGKNASKATIAIPILAVYHTCNSGTTYVGCEDTYEPTYVGNSLLSDDNITVSGDGKLCTVTGYVDQNRVEDIITENEKSKGCLNFDFTGAKAIGSYNYDMTDNKIAYFSKNVTAEGQNIVVGTTCEKYTISDAKEIYVNKSFSAEDATYERTFTLGSAATYATIILPFNVSNTSDVFERQAKFTGYDAENNKVQFTTADMLVANTPYLATVIANASQIKGDINTAVYATTGKISSATYNGAQFNGTYESVSGADLQANGFIVTSTGAMGKLKTTSTLKPTRCYYTYDGVVNAKIADATVEILNEDGTVEEIIVNLNGEETTAIDGVVDNNDVVSVQYISVNGQISNEPVKGMNIVKKVFADGSSKTEKVVY